MASFRTFQIWIARSETRGNQPPRSKFPHFAFTEMAATPAEIHRSGARRLVTISTLSDSNGNGTALIPRALSHLAGLRMKWVRWRLSHFWSHQSQLWPSLLRVFSTIFSGGSGSGSCSKIPEGAYRSAMRVALAEIDQGRSEEDVTRSSRGWKLFLLLPRLLLHKPPRGGLVPKKQLQHRFEVFSQGDWASLLKDMEHATRAAQESSRRSRRNNFVWILTRSLGT